ncbi:hydantoinase/oxoprolinase family protein [Streptomyces sp. NPDC048277]|uniref:hydantoinase/oxoprolinase family protein n=1 Tax=Streptomyces sp. NPDC048277 TaxID=3155027 RepID=UPI0033ECBEC8
MSYRIGVDIGGTFTDCVVVGEDGGRSVAKALTTPGALEQGVLQAVRNNAETLGVSLESLLSSTSQFVHGTTQATNAMLTRGGARTGLITSRGHEDHLIIGRVYSKMAGLHERDLVHSSRLEKPTPIIPKELTVGLNERIDRDGDVVVAVRDDEIVAAIEHLVAAGVEALAVSLLWSFANDVHERRVQRLVAEHAPDIFTAYSCEVAPVLGEYERTATTAVCAYVGPKVVSYLRRLEADLRTLGLRQSLLIMQASGGLTSVEDAMTRPIVTLDSGPTGGILGSRFMGELDGQKNIICTDVGGTSFDVGLILDGEVPLDHEPVVAQYTLRMPKVLVNTIGAGGGSLAWLDEGGLLRVGPQSAGSQPGPACYGLGGTQPTVTDADLVLGYLDGDAFLGGRMRLDRDRALRALAELGAPLKMEPEEAALGVFRIINSQMADLIRKSTIELGHDPRECVIAAYGGAGPTHAAFYGAEAGAREILVFQDSTVFSAEGMLTCDITHSAETSHQVFPPFDEASFAGMRDRLGKLEQDIIEQFRAEGTDAGDVTVSRLLGIRFRGQINTIAVPVTEAMLRIGGEQLMKEQFVTRYAQTYGIGAILTGGDIEIEPHRVIGTRKMNALPFPLHPEGGPDATAAVVGERDAYFEGRGYTATTVYDGYRLRAGNTVDGPAIIQRMGDSVVVPPGFQARVDTRLTLRISTVGVGDDNTPRRTTAGVGNGGAR